MTMAHILTHTNHHYCPDSKVHGANMGHTWVLSAPDGPHVGPMNLAIRGSTVTDDDEKQELPSSHMTLAHIPHPYPPPLLYIFITWNRRLP